MILKNHYRINIFNSSTKSGRDNEWLLNKKGSPGYLMEIEDLIEANDLSDSSAIIALNLVQNNDQVNVAVAYCNPDSREFYVAEFIDCIQLTAVESLLVQCEAKECLIPSSLMLIDLDTTMDSTNLKSNNLESRIDKTGLIHFGSIFERTGILLTEINKLEISYTNAKADLRQLLKAHCSDEDVLSKLNLPEFDCPKALALISPILKQDSSLLNSFSLNRLNLDLYMKLDGSAIRALHLLPSPDDYERLDLVEIITKNLEIKIGLYEDFLRRVPDMQKLGRKLQRKKASLQDMHRLYQACQRLPIVIELLSSYSGPNKHILQTFFIEPLEISVEHFSKYMEMIEETIDLEMASRTLDYHIKSQFSSTCQELREEIDQVIDEIACEARKISKKLDLEYGKSIKLDSNDQLGYFLRVTKKEETSLRDFKSLDIIDAPKGIVRFRSSTLSALNDKHLSLKSDYEEAQRSIVEELVQVAAGYVEPLYELNFHTAFLDVVTTLAVVSQDAPIPYVRPLVLSESHNNGIREINIINGRHPCLEAQGGSKVVPNNCIFNSDKEILKVITGPNMGGKSTFIRGVGVLVVMAQIGSFVPCDQMKLTPVDAVMARVGASDCLIRGVSTFLAEMLETAAVLRSATKNSLVIVDELGRGTSTYDGLGLAWSIAEHLATDVTLGCFTLFATHFHEIVSLADQLPDKVANYCVKAKIPETHSLKLMDEKTIEMLYKVEPGICDKSYGMEIARLAGLPSNVITDALKKAQAEQELENIWLLLTRGSENHSDKVC